MTIAEARRPSPRRSVLAFAVALALSTAEVAVAAPRTAREHLQEGLALAEKGEWEQALAAFEEAHHLDPQPTTLFDVAQARQKTGRYRSAIEGYRALLAAKASLSPHQLEIAQAQLAAAELRVARLTVMTTRLAPTDEVTVDDQRVQQWPILLDPGSHVARARRETKLIAEKRIDLAEGARTTIDLAPDAAGAVSAPPPPEAPSTAPSPTRPTWPAWVAIGAGAAVALGGAIFAVRGYGAWSDLNDGCGRTKTCPEDEVADAQRDVAIGDIAVGVGLAGIAVGAFLLLWHPSGRPAAVGLGRPMTF